jgi:hypothetical protein
MGAGPAIGLFKEKSAQADNSIKLNNNRGVLIVMVFKQ